MVENDTRIGRIMDKIRSLGLDKNTYVFWTTDNGAWQDVYPDAGYTPFRGTKGTVREGGNRVPSIAWGPGIKAAARNSDVVGGLDYMATFAKLAGVNLPERDREGQPIMFDSYDMSPILFGTGKSARKSWFERLVPFIRCQGVTIVLEAAPERVVIIDGVCLRAVAARYGFAVDVQGDGDAVTDFAGNGAAAGDFLFLSDTARARPSPMSTPRIGR